MRRTADPNETRREQALIQSTAAKLVMVRRQTEQLRDALVERDKSQAEIGAAAAQLVEALSATPLKEEIREALAGDLGDVAAESLRVTR